MSNVGVSSTYFSWSNIHNKRMFLIIGATKDKFVDDRFQLVSIQKIVFDELRLQGYNRIIFWNFRQGIYTYDEKSYSLMVSRTEKKTQNIQKRKVFGKACSGVLSQRNEVTQIDSAVNTTFQQNNKSKYRLSVTDAYSIFRMLRGFYEEKDIKTAIIIDDVKDFMERYSAFENVPPYFNQLASSTVPENNNFFVFIHLEEVLGDENDYSSKIIEEYRGNSLFQKMFMSFFPGRNVDTTMNAQTVFDKNPNLIQVKHPTAQEIRRGIHRLRFEKGLKIDYKNFDDICIEIERAFANLMKNNVINSWVLIEDRIGKNFIESGKILSLENWHEAIGVERPNSIRDEINALIGQKEIVSYLNTVMTAGKERRKREGRRLVDAPPSRLRWINPNVYNDTMKHIVLLGNPGTGKTTIARLIGRVLYEAGILERGHLIEGTRETLVGQYVGQTSYKTKNAISRAKGGVLFIDEAYELVKNDGSGNDFGQEAVAELIASMTKQPDFVVVLAGYRDKMRSLFRANRGLDRRVRKFILPDYTWSELRDILNNQLRSRKFKLSDDLNSLLDDFCKNWYEDNLENSKWGNGGEVDRLIEELELQFDALTQKDFGKNGEKLIRQEHLLSSNSNYKYYWVKRFSEPKRKDNIMSALDDMIGMDNIKQQLSLLYSSLDYYKNNPTERYLGSFHNLITGAPGTGKTRVARIIADIYRDAGLLKPGHFIRTNPTDFMGGSNSSTERAISEAIENAEGGVLFIDEAYALRDSHIAITKLVQAMTDYDGKFGLIIAGYKDEMDTLLSRNDGWERRFKNNRFNICSYTGNELASIFMYTTQKKLFSVDSELEKCIINMCNNWVEDNINERRWGNAGEIERLLESMILNFQVQNCRSVNPPKILSLNHLPEYMKQYLI